MRRRLPAFLCNTLLQRLDSKPHQHRDVRGAGVSCCGALALCSRVTCALASSLLLLVHRTFNPTFCFCRARRTSCCARTTSLASCRTATPPPTVRCAALCCAMPRGACCAGAVCRSSACRCRRAAAFDARRTDAAVARLNCRHPAAAAAGAHPLFFNSRPVLPLVPTDIPQLQPLGDRVLVHSHLPDSVLSNFALS